MYSRCTTEYAQTHDAVQGNTRDATLSSLLISILHWIYNEKHDNERSTASLLNLSGYIVDEFRAGLCVLLAEYVSIQDALQRKRDSR